jgi:predicted metal-dependent hydrolase
MIKNINDSVILGSLIIFIYILYKLTRKKLTMVEEYTNEIKFLVYNSSDKRQKSALLAEVISRMYKLRDYLDNNKEKYPDYAEYIELLKSNFNVNRTSIYENDPESDITSYSVNKGEELAFCLRSKKSNQLHNVNLIMYVALHEMAHMACPEIGHGELFKRIFRFLTQRAIDIGLYQAEDYSANPVEYCGMILSSTIL